MLATVAPKSDQLNADDLIGRTMTIKVREVTFKDSKDQPVFFYFEGDENKPYKEFNRVGVTPENALRILADTDWQAQWNADYLTFHPNPNSRSSITIDHRRITKAVRDLTAAEERRAEDYRERLREEL